MSATLNRWFPPFTLAVWGGISLYFTISGRLSAFLHPNFRPGVWVAGFVLLLLAVLTFVGAWRDGEQACCVDEACAHPLSRMTAGKFLTFGVLFLPLALAYTGGSDGFSLNAIENRGVITDVGALAGKRDVVFPGDGGKAGELMQISVIDLLYAARDRGLMGDFEGHRVEVVGQLMPEKEANPLGNRMKLVRMFMSCCAADAKPIAAILELGQKPNVPELSWVRVVGVPTFPMEGGRTIVVLKAESIEPTSPPDEAMLF